MWHRVVWSLVTLILVASTLIHGWTLPSFRRLVHFKAATDVTEIDEYFLQLALQQAAKAYRREEVPIGAVVVWNHTETYEILALAHNAVECKCDASAHAELLAMRRAARKRRNWRLNKAILYSTLEPCVMCCASAQAFRVQRIVYGGDDVRLGGIRSHMQLLETKHPYHTISNITGGVYANESQTLLRDFFHARRVKTKNQRKINRTQLRWWQRRQ